MRNVGETLAGRAAYLDLLPLSWSEIERRPKPTTVDDAFKAADADAFLATAYQIRMLTPFFPSVGKRLVKSPKVYAVDSGAAAWSTNAWDWPAAVASGGRPGVRHGIACRTVFIRSGRPSPPACYSYTPISRRNRPSHINNPSHIWKRSSQMTAIIPKEDVILYSGAANGAEAEFGACAEAFGIEEVNFNFDGHKVARTRGLRTLTHEELRKGEVSLAYVSKLMNRTYTDADLMKKVLQVIWYQVNEGQEIYVVGWILEDGTVKGGTGFGAEFAKLCNKPLFVFDQGKNGWFSWADDKWTACGVPTIAHPHICGTGTRFLEENGKAAIRDLFETNFGKRS